MICFWALLILVTNLLMCYATAHSWSSNLFLLLYRLGGLLLRYCLWIKWFICNIFLVLEFDKCECWIFITWSTESTYATVQYHVLFYFVFQNLTLNLILMRNTWYFQFQLNTFVVVLSHNWLKYWNVSASNQLCYIIKLILSLCYITSQSIHG